MKRVVKTGWLAFITTLVVGQPAMAQESSAGAVELVPPKLITYVEATYPEAAKAAGKEAAVLTEISIDETGKVTQVVVLEAAGMGFDEAAMAAIKQFQFEPAKNKGTPIPSKVRYRYTFFLSPQESSDSEEDVPPAPLPATLEGTVRDMDGQPIAEATVLLTPLFDMADTETDTTTDLKTGVDNQGNFALKDLSAGQWQVDVVAAGYKPLSFEESLEAGETRTVIYRLEVEQTQFETVVRDRKPQREVTRREITRREITKIPGTGGDALRAVQNLPGMARAPGFSGQLIVRGSSPQDSRYFFDQMPIPLLYHFGGLTSIINSDLLDRIDYYPGNYSVRYGGATGGIIDVYPKTPATDRVHGYVDADLWDVSGLLEVPLPNDWSIAVSARRSYIDAILTAVMPKDGGFQFTVAPRYYDYQLVADHHPKGGDKLRLFIFGSDDKAVFLFGDQVAGSPTFSGGINFRTLFHQAQLRWDRNIKKGVSNQLNLGVGFWRSDSTFGDAFQFINDSVPFFFRDELSFKTSDTFTLHVGMDTQSYWSRWKVVSATTLPQEGEQLDPLTDAEPFTSEGDGLFFWPAVYTEADWEPISGWRILPGLRLAWFDQVNRFGFDPRLSSRYKIFRKTTIKGGVGLFHQPPNTAQADKDFGTQNLQLIKAMHYSIGVEQDVTNRLNLSLELFYKKIYDLVVTGQAPDEEIFGSDSAQQVPRYNNDGEGRVYGFELMLKHQPTSRFFGWISYTFMNSSRIDHPGMDARPFDYDQTHILTVVGSVVLGRGWEAGIRYRLVTGNPDTPVIGSFYHADADTYWPLYGPTNSDRLPPFHQLDVRVDKVWRFKRVNYSVYVDIQNIYNRKNPEGYQYNYDFSERAYFNGLPILPSLGMKLEY